MAMDDRFRPLNHESEINSYPLKGLLTVRKLRMNSLLTSTIGNIGSEIAKEMKTLGLVQDRARVTWPTANPIARNSEAPYATVEDFHDVFTNETSSLYLLSFLLTASHEKAERCLLDGFSECIDGPPVFRGWVRSWARRALIRNAIRIVAPCDSCVRDIPNRGHSRVELSVSWSIPNDASLANVLALRDFERFVFVISVLERYLDQNCASLLGTSRRRVQDSRVRALMQVTDIQSKYTNESRATA